MTHRIQQSGPPGSGRVGVFWRTALLWGAVCGLARPASAQFLRLGIFDVTAETSIDLIYTSNVEGQRPSEAKYDMTDYYMVPRLQLLGEAPFGRGTQLTLDTSVGFEKHLIRTDLDSESAPFGKLRLDTRTELARYQVNLYAGYGREYNEEEDIYVPGDRKTRDVTDTREYGGDVIWTWRALTLGGRYEFTGERHLDPTFEDGDQDETVLGWNAACELRENLALNYDYQRTRTVLVNELDEEPTWEVEESITVDWQLPLWERPTITYSFGFEREGVVEDPQDRSGDWDIIHTLTADGVWDLTSTLMFSLHASYEYESDPEENDVSLTYGLELAHELSGSARQTLTAEREPVSTFGSTAETDKTTIEYIFSKSDLFVYDLDLDTGVGWELDVPLEEGEDVEEIWDYHVGLTHSRTLSRRLVRDLSYLYTCEMSNLEDELLQEHRVTLTFTYSF